MLVKIHTEKLQWLVDMKVYRIVDINCIPHTSHRISEAVDAVLSFMFVVLVT